MRWPILGCIPGIAAGMLFVNVVSEDLLRRSLGALALALAVLLIVRDRWYPTRVFAPRWWHGVLVGAVAGFSSTLAHAAGPIMALYLMAQRVDKRTFVATSAVFFFCTNLMKLPPYVATGLVDVNILKTAAWLAPMLPVGIGIGWLFNRWISQKHFTYVVYALLLVAGVDLLFR